jgi:hypothetical protein
LDGWKYLEEISGSHGGVYQDGLLRRVVWQKFRVISEVLAVSISSP